MEYYNEMRNRSWEMRDKFTAGQAMKSLIQHYGHFYSGGEKITLQSHLAHCALYGHWVRETG